MKAQAICYRCKNEFVYDAWESNGKYCSTKCIRSPKKEKLPRFEWKKATEEQKLQRITEAFEKSVIKGNKCWEWLGNIYPNGYGKFPCSINGVRPSAHRISWMIHYGIIPPDKIICHTCDNRSCTNPQHLFLGTQADNIRDMHEKNRGMIGQTHVNSKLKKDDVIIIKKLLKDRQSHTFISKQFNVCRATITSIKTGKTWAHIKESND